MHKNLFYTLISILFILHSTALNAAILFEDASQTSGISFQSRSFGAGSWGDYNGDGLPDLWLGNHGNHPSLFVNQGDGTFLDVAPLVVQFPRDPAYIDAHGAQWADIDRDGDMDLIEMTGARSGHGSESSLLWLNQAGQLVDSASTWGVDYPTCRGRTPLIFDWNNDGWLDLLMTCTRSNTAPSSMFTNQSGLIFSPLAADKAFSPPNANGYAQLTDANNDGVGDIYIAQHNNGGVFVNTQTIPWEHKPKSNTFNLFKGVSDSAFEDIDGDLIADKIAVKTIESGLISDMGQVTSNAVQVSLLTNNGSAVTTQLQTLGSIDVTIESGAFNANNIHIGAAGSSPNAMTFSLQPTDPNVLGIQPYVLGTDSGLYIGYDSATSTWTVTQTSTQYVSAVGRFFSSSNMTITKRVGLPTFTSSLKFNTSSTNTYHSLPIQLGTSIVVADFDNDMDQDIYVVRSRPAINLPNSLLSNDGSGTFTEEPSSADSQQGIGDGVSTVDYDGDGLVDLLITNGAGPKLLGESGYVQLLKNVTSAQNHWLEIDLHGTASNLEGIGATVHVDVAGITQMRYQAGGMHRFTQNHSRLHFGLAQHTSAITVRVLWPSGTRELWSNINADQILQLTEGTGTPL